jgi:peptidoglycan/xylan/chitin deacetylase (PgdA/CDA1 family)
LRLCAVSVDLDEIPNYFRIHGLADPGGPEKALVYDVAIDRLESMARGASMPLTFFAIGQDLERPQAAMRLARARSAGHEIANHTLGHRYDLVRLARAEIRSEIEEGARAIERAVGERPVGFRAPGYTITDEVFDVLRELGVAYDSSVFPCPSYWALKAAAITLIRARGRASHSIVDTPHVLCAPTRPYRIGRPYWERGDRLLEIPIQVTRRLRLPFFGTSITMRGPGFARALARGCIGEPLINLELHGIDVLDASDGLESLRPYQLDVRIPKARKLDALHATFDILRGAGYTFVTLCEAAEQAARAA